MTIDLSAFPYLDRTEEERTKGYTTMVGVPDRYLQARELTQLNRLLQYQIRDIGNILFNQGAVLEGCQLTISGNQATVTAGKIYYNGFVLPIPETTLTITKQGTESIGVKITESIVTEEEDSSLRDPYPAGRGYNRPGMHRIKITTEVVLSDQAQLKLYELADGVPKQTRKPTEFSEIINILARRTYDESENYLVRGLEVSCLPREDGKADIAVSPGKAYVLGYEVELPSPHIHTVNPSTDYTIVTDEMYPYNSNVTTYKIYQQPVSSVISVQANVRVENFVIYHSAAMGGADTIPFPNVLNVIEVRQGSTVYVRGTDYNIINQNIIDWSPQGNEPAPGSAYTVTFVYHKVLTSLDYEVITDSQGEKSIHFLPTHDNIVDGSYFEVDYTYYLSRIDILYLDSDGNTFFLHGIPEKAGNAKRPIVPYNVLPLAEIYFPPNSNQLQIKNYQLKRVTMYQLNEIIERLKQLEYNLAVTQLDDPGQRGASPSEVVGTFSEGFVGFSRASVHHPAFSGIIVPNLRIFIPDYDVITPVSFTVQTSTAQKAGNVYVLPYTNTVYIQQPMASKTVNVNKYAVFQRIPIISVDPPSHTFYEKVYVSESNQINIVSVSTRTIDDWQRAGTVMVKDTLLSSWFNDKLLAKEVMEYIPSFSLSVTGTNFYPNQDNLTVYFDGVKMIATPTNNTPLGTEAGTVKSKADGTLSLTFNIPANRFYTGMKKVEVKNQFGGAETSFYATGIRELYEKVRVQNFSRNVTVYTRPRPVEPLAQSFFVPQNCFLTAVGLYFKTKDPTVPLIVELRELVNGFPGPRVLARKVVSPANITTSNNSSVETVVTFDTPAYVEGGNMYCVVLTSDSNNYEVFCAEMGQTDILTGAPINKQAYDFGNMFSSSDAQSWNVHQIEDLKFRLYRARFQTSEPKEVVTNNASASFTSFLPNLTAVVPDGTRVVFYYSTNNGDTWSPMENLATNALNSLGTQIRYKAVLSSTSEFLSPLLSEEIQGVHFRPKTTATYISRQVTTRTNFTNVEVWVDIYRPVTTLCNATVSYSIDSGQTWVEMTYNQNEITAPAYNWERRKYTATVSGGANRIVVRVDLTTTDVLYQPACSNLIVLLR